MTTGPLLAAATLLMVRKAAFGKPQPLPGQAGYKAKPSEKLEREALAMEAQLEALRATMEQERSGGAVRA